MTRFLALAVVVLIFFAGLTEARFGRHCRGGCGSGQAQATLPSSISASPGSCCPADCPCGALDCPADCPCAGDAWYVHSVDPGRRYLYRRGQLLGGYDVAGKYYRSYHPETQTWGPVESSLPAACPAGSPTAVSAAGGCAGGSCEVERARLFQRRRR